MDTPLTIATVRVDCTVMVIAITKHRNVEMPTTETAHVFIPILATKLLALAHILADIMTTRSNGVSTIRALVLTITRTANATSIGPRISQQQPARLSEDITLTKATSLDDTVMSVTSTNLTAATRQTISATHCFHRHIPRARAIPSEVITHETTKDATIIPFPAHIR